MRLRFTVSTVVIGVALLAAACASDESASEEAIQPSVDSSTATTVATTTVAPTTTSSTTTTTTVAPTTTTSSPPTELTVEVNGALLAYECRGEGSPTVLVERGFGGATAFSPDWGGWGEALDGIAELTHVCIYGRRGTGGSDPLPKDSLRTTMDQVDDLDGLIVALGLETPLVLVGHSIAGFNLRVFTDRYPELVSGLVFVDASHPDVDFDTSPIDIFPEYLDNVASSDQVRSTGQLGDLPLYVLTASETVAYYEPWAGFQEDLAALSTTVRHKTTPSGHEIYRDDPRSVVGSVRSILKTIG